MKVYISTLSAADFVMSCVCARETERERERERRREGERERTDFCSHSHIVRTHLPSWDIDLLRKGNYFGVRVVSVSEDVWVLIWMSISLYAQIHFCHYIGVHVLIHVMLYMFLIKCVCFNKSICICVFMTLHVCVCLSLCLEV